MLKIETGKPEEVYDRCLCSGKIKEKNKVDIELIKSLKDVAEKGIKFINDRSKDIKKDSTDWTFVFRDHYESLRGLIEAYLLFDKIEADNHQCKNAYLCVKHPELEMNWEFLEAARMKRNAINYCGQLLRYYEWNLLNIHFGLHINKLKKEIEKKIKEHTD
jgi:hypothetical protein